MTIQEIKQILSDYNPDLDNSSMLMIDTPGARFAGFNSQEQLEENSDKAIAKVYCHASDDARIYVLSETTESELREWIEEYIAEYDKA